MSFQSVEKGTSTAFNDTSHLLRSALIATSLADLQHFHANFAFILSTFHPAYFCVFIATKAGRTK